MNNLFSPRRHRGTEYTLFEWRISVPPCLCGCILLLLAAACGYAPRPPIVPAFYHWQTQLALTGDETAYLDSLGCRKLYVKFLDVARDPASGEIRPYSLLEVSDTAGLSGKTVVPCIFITNSVFRTIDPEKTDWLVRKTTEALQHTGRQFPDNHFREVQFDCDWTADTRVVFFAFLTKMRNALPPETALSVTIRLHQYKFPDRTGVPPADRGMLMLYNTGDIDDWTDENSIFQPAAAQKYLRGAPARYPLPLDVALPVFSWALVYRDGGLWKIIPEPGLAEFRDTSRFENSTPALLSALPTRFRLRRATLLAGHYLRPDDLIRLENIDTALLRQAALLAAGITLAPGANVAFYHLDTGTVRRYPVKALKTVWETINDRQQKSPPD